MKGSNKIGIVTLATALMLGAGPALTAMAEDARLATWNGSFAGAEEIEELLSRSSGRGGKAGNIDAQVELYSRAARTLALQKIVETSVTDADALLAGSPEGTRLRAARQRALLDRYLDVVRSGVVITDEAVGEYYESHAENFRIPRSLTLWNIYRRHEGDPEQTSAFLSELRSRVVEGGEDFSSIAREHSQSETRLRDGKVGNFTEGKLPPALAETAFSLGEGEVSEPLAVADGAVLLHVTDVTEASMRPLDEASDRIRAMLLRRGLEGALAARVAEAKPPEGSTVLTGEQLEALLDGSDKEATAIEIGDFRLTAREIVGTMRSVAQPDRPSADEGEGEAVKPTRSELRAHSYRGVVHRALLYNTLQKDSSAEVTRARTAAKETLRTTRARLLMDAEVRRRARVIAAAETAELQKFFDDNAHHFRGEAGPLTFEQAREQVLDEYFERHEQDFSEKAREETLAKAGYAFDDARTRAHLALR